MATEETRDASGSRAAAPFDGFVEAREIGIGEAVEGAAAVVAGYGFEILDAQFSGSVRAFSAEQQTADFRSQGLDGAEILYGEVFQPVDQAEG